MAKDRSAVAVLFLAWARLGRLASRFEALVQAVGAGRLPPAAVRRGQAERDLELPRLEGLPPPPGAAVYGSQVQHWLADPEMAALLASAPQAERILRPLCRMLGIRLGPELVSKRRRRSASGAGPVDSNGQPDASATRAVASFSLGGSGPRARCEALPASPGRSGLPRCTTVGAAKGAQSRLGDCAGTDPPLAPPAPGR